MELFGVFSIACNLCFQFNQVAASFPQTLFLIFRVSAENHAVCQAKFCNVLKTSVMFPSFRLESAGTANCPQALFFHFPAASTTSGSLSIFMFFSAPFTRSGEESGCSGEDRRPAGGQAVRSVHRANFFAAALHSRRRTPRIANEEWSR